MEWKTLAEKLDTYCKEHNESPKSPKDIGLTSNELFKNIKEVEEEVWKKGWLEIKLLLDQDTDFEDYPSKQKWIATNYVFLQLFGRYKDYLRVRLDLKNYVFDKGQFVKFVLQSNSSLISDIIQSGDRDGSVELRWLFKNYYPNLFAEHIVGVAYYFGRDQSDDKEGTDAFIDKTTNLLFEVLGKNVLERSFELGKFLLESFKQAHGSTEKDSK
ncbi:MAG: hypothetical protein MRY83_12305 [Flavobacteriales bacterium]|nr:hypothetical protein [Flavobacteriales bacterium]